MNDIMSCTEEAGVKEGSACHMNNSTHFINTVSDAATQWVDTSPQSQSYQNKLFINRNPAKSTQIYSFRFVQYQHTISDNILYSLKVKYDKHTLLWFKKKNIHLPH